jgi:hypothetical protein
MTKTDLTTVTVLDDHDTRSLERQLDHAIASLRGQIAKSPKLSATAANARRLIENVTTESRLTTAQKLEAVREVLRGYATARLVDNVLGVFAQRPKRYIPRLRVS